MRILLKLAFCLTLSAIALFFAPMPSSWPHTQKKASGKVSWHVATYRGLTPGRSTAADVKRVFGKPLWSGPIESEDDPDRPEQIVFEYENVGDFVGQTSVLFKPNSDVIDDILIYPQRLLFADLRKDLDSIAIERHSKLGPCPTQHEIERFSPPKELEYPAFLVYPRLGRYAAVDADNKVSMIVYASHCGDMPLVTPK